ncbi:transmembrane emp24 domain-containing protein 9-like [Scomber japonicus]|uniref:transmembrane emp24 domain-containing protein 9-like n=1 Tax=Scomber japonicus TaxID=13676 RepID=UPI002305B3E0|nr:transmembrane emp24 domain-containing protein 9-like [Scomber japonicus]
MAPVGTQRSVVFIVLFLNFFYTFVSSLYFNIGEKEQKCFIEEISDLTAVKGDFRIQLLDHQRNKQQQANQELGILVIIKDPDEELLWSRSYGSEGSFTFTAWRTGRHLICLQPKSSDLPPLSAGGSLVLHLDIRVGERVFNYTRRTTNRKLTELQLRVQQLYEQVDQIMKQHQYQKFQEERFRDVNHKTNMWIFWWPFVRSLYVVAVVMWHTNTW